MTEQERKEIYAQSELMRQQQAMNDSGFYAPEQYDRGRNSGGGVMSFGQDFGSPYVSEGLESAKMDVPDYSAIELGEGDIYEGLKDLETVEGLTGEYYQNVDKLKYLANTAASQGWNVTQLNFRDPNKRAISEAYRNLLSTTKGMGNMLKGGYEARKSIMDKGQIRVSRDSGMEGVGTVTSIDDRLDPNKYISLVEEANDALANSETSPAAYKLEKQRMDNLRKQFLNTSNNPNVSAEERKLAREAYYLIGNPDQNTDLAELNRKKKEWSAARNDKDRLGQLVVSFVQKIHNPNRFTSQEDVNGKQYRVQDAKGLNLIVDGNKMISKIYLDPSNPNKLFYKYSKFETDADGKLIKGSDSGKIESDLMPMPSDLDLMMLKTRAEYGQSGARIADEAIAKYLDEKNVLDIGGNFKQEYNAPINQSSGGEEDIKKVDVANNAILKALSGQGQDKGFFDFFTNDGSVIDEDNPVSKIIDSRISGGNDYKVSSLNEGLKDNAMVYEIDTKPSSVGEKKERYFIAPAGKDDNKGFQIVTVVDGQKQLTPLDGVNVNEDGYNIDQVSQWIKSNNKIKNSDELEKALVAASDAWAASISDYNKNTRDVGVGSDNRNSTSTSNINNSTGYNNPQ